jgi:hypothetical protein
MSRLDDRASVRRDVRVDDTGGRCVWKGQKKCLTSTSRARDLVQGRHRRLATSVLDGEEGLGGDPGLLREPPRGHALRLPHALDLLWPWPIGVGRSRVYPTCVEEKFSEVRGYKRAPIRAPRLPLAPHTIPARPD